MRKSIHFILGLLLFVSISPTLQAQPKYNGQVKVAIFAPLYINDAFSGSTYKLGKNSLPKNLLPGLEFYNGAMMAIDSLREEGVSVEFSIYDTKDASEFHRVLAGQALANTGLIIAAITNSSELFQLSNVALHKNIPLISATYPNAGNITSNPYFVLLNSSLHAHVEGIYKYLQRNHSLDNLVIVKRNGAAENYISNTFNELNKSTKSAPLKPKWVELTDTFTTFQLVRHLDSTRRNVVMVASPSENFGVKVVRGINTINYSNTIIGMPTWDGIREFNRNGLRNVEIIYTTPFNYSRYNAIGSRITNSYRARFNSRPSDMVYRGYETVFHFTKLLLKHQEKLADKLSDDDHTIFNQFDIKQVQLKKDNKKPDYYENKKLYFIKKQGGDVTNVTSL